MSTERKDNGKEDHPTPDSTTNENTTFCIGDDVLLQKIDGNFYLGLVVKIDLLNDQCQVWFGDDTTTWSPITKLTKLSTLHRSMCVKCKISRTDTNNDIPLCDKCLRGHQQNCLYDNGTRDHPTPDSTTKENIPHFRRFYKDNGNGDYPTPDSTTKEKTTFCIGDEVLLQKNDGNFYLGAVLKIDLLNDQYQVRFGDNTTTWSPITNLTKLSTGHGVMCVKCKISRTNADNGIAICDKCLRGYHQKCHYPPISEDCLLDDVRWECIKCTNRNLLPLENTTAAPAQPSACSK